MMPSGAENGTRRRRIRGSRTWSGDTERRTRRGLSRQGTSRLERGTGVRNRRSWARPAQPRHLYTDSHRGSAPHGSSDHVAPTGGSVLFVLCIIRSVKPLVGLCSGSSRGRTELPIERRCCDSGPASSLRNTVPERPRRSQADLEPQSWKGAFIEFAGHLVEVGLGKGSAQVQAVQGSAQRANTLRSP